VYIYYKIAQKLQIKNDKPNSTQCAIGAYGIRLKINRQKLKYFI